MKKITKDTKTLLPIKLNFFSETAVDGAADAAAGASGVSAAQLNATAPAADGAADTSEDPPEAPKSYTTEEIRKIVNDAITAAEEAKKKALEAAKAKEGMTPEEQFEQEKKEFRLKSAMLDAKEVLVEKGLSADFAQFLAHEDSEQTKANIDAFEKFFRAQVQAGVEARLKGSTPKSAEPDGAQGGTYRSAIEELIRKQAKQ